MTRLRYFDHQFASVHEIVVPSPPLALARVKWVEGIVLVTILLMVIFWGGMNV